MLQIKQRRKMDITGIIILALVPPVVISYLVGLSADQMTPILMSISIVLITIGAIELLKHWRQSKWRIVALVALIAVLALLATTCFLVL